MLPCNCIRKRWKASSILSAYPLFSWLSFTNNKKRLLILSKAFPLSKKRNLLFAARRRSVSAALRPRRSLDSLRLLQALAAAFCTVEDWRSSFHAASVFLFFRVHPQSNENLCPFACRRKETTLVFQSHLAEKYCFFTNRNYNGYI